MNQKKQHADVADQNSHPEEYAVRLKKVEEMRKLGIEPWRSPLPINSTSQEFITKFSASEKPDLKQYTIAGRITSIREHGKTIFATIQDSAGQLQVYIRKDAIGEKLFLQWQLFIDLGDIVWFRGTSFKTKMGEISLAVEEFVLLSKCLQPLPSNFYGIDVETKYRQRYLDLIIDETDRKRFVKRSNIISAVRHFLESHQFMEVETPMLHPIPGGAAARPFMTHHNALDMELYLRIAPELYLKRLVVGGFDRVFEINRNFRNEGISTRHNPEFTMLEFYAAHQDYVWVMDFVEELFRHAISRVQTSLQVTYDNKILDFEQPFTRMTMLDAVKKYTHCNDAQLQENTIMQCALRTGTPIDADKRDSWGHVLYALFEHCVEPHLIQPTFITQFPVAVSPLAKRNSENPELTDRFELFIANMELGNGFTELNDPQDQARRFEEQAKEHSGGNIEAHRYDADFITALEYALPPTVGCGIGIDRLSMLLTNTTSIKDVILFPTLRNK